MSRPPSPLIVSGPAVPVSVWAALDADDVFASAVVANARTPNAVEDEQGAGAHGHNYERCPARPGG